MTDPFDGRFERRDLPGAVRLHLAPTRKFKTATIKVFMRCDLEPRVASEVAALPFVLRRGTESVPSSRGLSRELESLFGSSLEPHLDKVGEQQVLSFSLRCLGERFLPEGKQVLPRGVRLLSDLFHRPARDAQGHLRAEEVAQEKIKIQRRLEGLLNDKGAYAAERLVSIMCAGEPYSVFEFGSLADLPHLTGENLEARRQALIADSPLDVYAVGAFDPDRLTALIAEHFERTRAGVPPERGTTPHPAPLPQRDVTERLPGIKQSKLCMGLRTDATLGTPGFWNQLVSVGVLGGFVHSKLFRNVREAEGLCYHASASFEQFKGLVFMYAGIDVENAERTRDMCLAQVEAMRQGDISDEELDNTRAAFRQAYRGVLDAPTSLIHFDYFMQLHGGSGRPSDASAAIESVTRDDVQAAAEAMRLDTVYLLAPEEEDEAPQAEAPAAAD